VTGFCKYGDEHSDSIKADNLFGRILLSQEGLCSMEFVSVIIETLTPSKSNGNCTCFNNQ
jgi:hypothetical protein